MPRPDRARQGAVCRADPVIAFPLSGCPIEPGWTTRPIDEDNPSVEARVLIVEDDPSLREIIRLGLEVEGFSVVEAGDGPTALSVFDSDNPDLVLLDIMLPGKDGFEVCRELRKTSLVPIVILTARASTVDIIVGLESGADDYVTKPFEFPELVARNSLGSTTGLATAITAERQHEPSVPRGQYRGLLSYRHLDPSSGVPDTRCCHSRPAQHRPNRPFGTA